MIKYHENLYQGTEQWLQARCGLLTASEMKHIITPAKLQYSTSEKEKTHLYELAHQRITQYVEPGYQSYEMKRGQLEELDAKITYNEHYGAVREIGFVTNDTWGFILGYSPDGLIGDDGTIECKSRLAKYQIETITSDTVPQEFMIQIQTGLLVSGRAWCDFISYSNGLPMFTKRVEANAEMQRKILEAAGIFHQKLEIILDIYRNMLGAKEHRLIPTERKIYNLDGDITA